MIQALAVRRGSTDPATNQPMDCLLGRHHLQERHHCLSGRGWLSLLSALDCLPFLSALAPAMKPAQPA